MISMSTVFMVVSGSQSSTKHTHYEVPQARFISWDRGSKHSIYVLPLIYYIKFSTELEMYADKTSV